MTPKRSSIRALRPGARVWLESGDQPVFGDGRARLLRAVRDSGSISAAARSVGMSYRHAWRHLHNMEQRLGVPLLERRRGGARGGGCRLTPDGRRLLAAFERFRAQLDADLQALWRDAARRQTPSRSRAQ